MAIAVIALGKARVKRRAGGARGIGASARGPGRVQQFMAAHPLPSGGSTPELPLLMVLSAAALPPPTCVSSRSPRHRTVCDRRRNNVLLFVGFIDRSGLQ